MKKQILVIGRNADIVAILEKAINKNEHWQAFSALEDERAVELFHQHPIDIVLLSSGIEPESETKLRKLFMLQNTDIIIIQHYGGGTGLLENEIRSALETIKPGISIQDNPFSQ